MVKSEAAESTLILMFTPYNGSKSKRTGSYVYHNATQKRVPLHCPCLVNELCLSHITSPLTAAHLYTVLRPLTV